MFCFMRSISKTLLCGALTGFLLSCCLSCSVDDYEIYATILGEVADAETDLPLSGALVTISPTNQTKRSGEDGTFMFENLDAGQYNISVQKDGYQTNRKVVQTFSGEEASVNILLKKINQ